MSIYTGMKSPSLLAQNRQKRTKTRSIERVQAGLSYSSSKDETTAMGRSETTSGLATLPVELLVEITGHLPSTQVPSEKIC